LRLTLRPGQELLTVVGVRVRPVYCNVARFERGRQCYENAYLEVAAGQLRPLVRCHEHRPLPLLGRKRKVHRQWQHVASPIFIGQ